MAEDNLGELLNPTGYERAHKLFFLLAKAVPLPLNLAEIAQTLVGDPSQKRLESFFKLVAEQLQKLADEVEDLDFDSPAFQSTCIHATEIALRTHLEEKRQLLCNAILNSALPSELPDEVRGQKYLTLLGKFGPTHVRLLKAFASDKIAGINIELGDSDWVMVGGEVDRLQAVLDVELPETIGDENLRFPLVNDLYLEGLIANRFPERNSLTGIEYSPKVTQLGKGFLRFIESPLEKLA
jgi:hypothetical protein